MTPNDIAEKLVTDHFAVEGYSINKPKLVEAIAAALAGDARCDAQGAHPFDWDMSKPGAGNALAAELARPPAVAGREEIARFIRERLRYMPMDKAREFADAILSLASVQTPRETPEQRLDLDMNLFNNARAEAIEECARIAEQGAKQCTAGDTNWHQGFRYAATNTALGIADAIRALSRSSTATASPKPDFGPWTSPGREGGHFKPDDKGR